MLRKLHMQIGSDKKVSVICDDMRLDQAAHLLKFDSIHGIYPGSIDIDDRHLIVDGHAIDFVRDTGDEAWSAMRKADVVINTRRSFLDPAYRDDNDLSRNIVTIDQIFSAPDERATGAANRIIRVSMSSEACFAALVGVLTRRLGFAAAIVTTVHSYTNEQVVVDGEADDLRKGRAAPISVIPYPLRDITQFGGMGAELAEKVAGIGLSVPVQRVSLMEVVFATAYDSSREDVNLAFRDEARSDGEVLGYSNDSLVSIDFAGRPQAAVFDAQQTLVAGKRLVRIAAWFDDEWSLATRIIRVIDTLDIET